MFCSAQIKPVAGYEDLVEANETLIRGNAQLRSVLMINCGAGIDLVRCLSLPDEAICYVVDSHRPYRLENAFDQNNILLLDDGRTLEEQLEPYRLAMEAELAQAADDSDNGDDDDDNDGDGDGGAADGDDDDENGALNAAAIAGGAQRKRRSQALLERQKRRRVVRRRLARVFREPKLNRAYYELTSFGMPASFIMYELASQLGKTSNELLWLAIVGLTDQHVHERITADDYAQLVALYTDEVLTFNDVGGSGGGGGYDDAALRAADRIVHQDEFDLMLLRHWTLYDSLVHSRYVGTRLGAWKERGAEEIGRLLVTMGLPLDQCRESYATMRAQFKDQLADRLDEFAPRFGLSRLRYRSFHRQLGFKQGVSAADVVHAVTALLEAPEDVDATANALADLESEDDDDADAANNGGGGGDAARRPGTGLSAAAAALADEDAVAPRSGPPQKRPIDEEREYRVATAAWQRSFWRAYDALASNMSGAALLERGIRCAKRVHQAIVREGSVMLERKAIVSQGAFRYAFLTHSGDAKYFTRPLALSRLARFLVDARRTKKTGKRSLVLLALDEASDSYLIVGVEGGGSNVPSAFGKHFRRAAERAKAQVKWHGWEASVVQISRGEVERWEERMVEQMNL